MPNKQRVAKAGSLLRIDRGAFSDYGLVGFFVVLREFDPMVKLDEFLAEHPEQRTDCGFDDDQFLASLLSRGLLLEIEHGNLYLGAYHDPSTVLFAPACERWSHE